MVDRSQVPVFKQDPILVLVLGFVTCGIYMIYWNIKMAEVLNAVSERELISPVVAILGGLCWPVPVYYYYLAGQALRGVGSLVGREEEMASKSTLLLILAIFVPQVAAMIIQGHVNEIYTAA